MATNPPQQQPPAKPAPTPPEIYDKMILVETADYLYIQPAYSSAASDERILCFNRYSDQISMINRSEMSGGDRLRTIMIGGVIGVVNLLGGPYLIIVKSGTRIGDFAGGHVIWQLNQFDLIPFRRTLGFLNEKQVEYNNVYLEMVQTVLTTPHFYYSKTYDLSYNLQTLENNAPNFFQQTLVQRSDPRYAWNASLLSGFGGEETHRYLVPLIHGYCSITKMKIDKNELKLILISRRNTGRPGTRLFSRGIDDDGNVANFVETEQLIEFGDKSHQNISSFVQIRGSVPLYWNQNPNLKYKPSPTLVPNKNHSAAFGKHFNEMSLNYNRVVIINLVNQSGSENVLETRFREEVQRANMDSLEYDAFDFHHECRSMHWEKTEILINRLMRRIDEFGFFYRLADERQNQEGVFRTNCVDCLDRTNVIQGLLARKNFDRVLRLFEIFQGDEELSNHSEAEGIFKNIWADNGDIISIQYSGTGALKSDFTRTGKRSYLGALRDGYNSAIRYFKNNFNDGYRTDSINLFLGKYQVNAQEGSAAVCPLESRNRDWKFFSLPALLVASFIMLIFTASVQETSPPQYYWIPIFLFGSITFTSGFLIIRRGRSYVDNPCLRRNEDDMQN